MKNILIIGNGFDLAHDLNTSYKDFVKFCECIKIFFESDYYNKMGNIDIVSRFSSNSIAIRGNNE